MSAVIDERIVELQFDNQRFERNVKQTMNTLDGLDQRLDKMDGGNAFSKLNAAVSKIDFSPITNAAYAAANGFSAMEVAGITVITRLTNAAMDFGKNLWNNTIGQIKSGGWSRAMNVEQAHHMIKGFGLDADQLTEDAKYAVQDTAYGFDEAARAAATFGTAGVKAGDDMKKALLGVSGVASITNSGFTEIADIYTKIATMGKLTRNQMESFQVRGLNVTATLAEQLGKSQQEIEKMVTKGQIDFNTFAKAMHDAFGEHAKSANETFNGAMGNMRAALSRIGEDFATVYIKDMIPVFNGLKTFINDVHTALDPVIKDFTFFMDLFSKILVQIISSEEIRAVMYNILGGVRNLFYEILLVLMPIKEAFSEIFPEAGLNTLVKAAEFFRELTSKLIISEDAANFIKVTFLGLFSAVKILIIAIKELVGVAIQLYPVFSPVLTIFKNMGLAISNTIIILAKMIEAFGGIRNTIKMLGTDAVDNFFKMNGINVEESGLYKFAMGLVRTTIRTYDSIFAIGSKMTKLFGTIKEMIDSFFAGFKKEAGKEVTDPITEGIDKTLDNVEKRYGILTKIGEFVHGIFEKISNLAKTAMSSITSLIFKTSDATTKAGTAMGNSTNKLGGMMEKIKVIFGKIGEIFGRLIARISDKFNNASLKEITAFIKALMDMPVAAAMAMWYRSLTGVNKRFEGLEKSISGLINAFKNNFQNVGKNLSNVLGAVKNSLNAFTQEIQARALKQLATSIAILAGALLILSLINPSDMAPALGAIMTLIATMTVATKELDSMNTFTRKEGNMFGGAATMMVKMATGVLILSAAVKSLSSVDLAGLVKGIAAVNVMMWSMTGMAVVMSKQLGEGANKGIKAAAKSLVTMSFAMLLLSIPIKSLAKLELGDLVKGLTAVIIGMGTMVLLMERFSNVNKSIDRIGQGPFGGKDSFLNVKTNKGLLAAGLAIVALASSMAILTSSIKKLADLSWEQLAKGLAGVTVGLGVMVLLLERLKDHAASMLVGAVGIVILSSSLLIFAESVNRLSALSWDDLARSLIAAVVGIGAMTASMAVLSNLPFSKLLMGSLAMTILGSALQKIVEPILALSKLNSDQLAYSLIGFLTIVGAMTAALFVLANTMDGQKLVNVAIGFQTLGMAIAAVAPAMAILGKMGLWDIIKSLIAIAGALAIIGAAAELFAPALPAMVGLSVVLVAIAASVGILGAGVLMLSAGMAALAVSGVAGTAALIEMLKEIITLAPVIGSAVMDAIAGMCQSFVNNAPAFYQATLMFFTMMNNALMTSFLMTINNVRLLLTKILDLIIELTPKFTEAALNLLESIIIQIKYLIPELVNIGMLAMESLLHAIEAHMQDFVETGGRILINFIQGLMNVLPDLINASILLVITFIHGMADGIRNNSEELIEAMKDLIDAVLDAMQKAIIGFIDIGGNIIEGIVNGLLNGMDHLKDTAISVANSVITTMKDILGIHSPSTVGYEMGGYLDQGLANGITDGKSDIVNAATGVATDGTDAMADGIDDGKSDVVDAGKQVGADTATAANNALAGGLNFDAILGSEAAQALMSRYNINLLPQQEKKISANDIVHVADDEGYTQNMVRWEAEGYKSAAAWEEAHKAVKDTGESAENAADGIDKMTSAAKENTKVTDKMKDNLTDTLDIFSQFSTQTSLTGRDILKTFMSELKGVATWEEEIQALASRGMNQNYLKELADQGPKAYEQIHAFYKMSEDEMSLFNKMYAQKLMIQRDTAQKVRKTFVDTGNMLKNEFDKYGKTSGDIYMEKLAQTTEKKADGTAKEITASQQKALEEAQEQIAIDKINDEFIEKWAGELNSSGTILSLKDAFGKLGLASMDAFEQSVNFERAIDQVIAFRASIEQQVRGSMKLFDEVKVKSDKEIKEEQISTTQMLYNMAENTKKVGKWANNLRKLADKGMAEGLLEELRALGPEGADKVDAFVRMTADELKKANSLYESAFKAPEYISDEMAQTYLKHGFTKSMGFTKDLMAETRNSFLFDFQRTGEDATSGFVQGIDPTAANEAMTYLGENSLEALRISLDSHSPSRKAEDIGIDFVRGFTLEEKQDVALRQITTFTKDIAGSALDGLRRYLNINRVIAIGEDFMKGFGAGLKKGLSSVTKIIDNATKSIVTKFSLGLGVHSPSVIAQDIMENFLKGAMIPLTDDESVSSAAMEQAKSIVDMFNRGMDSGAFVEDIYEPTIRPIWDDTNIINGMTGINDVLNNVPFNLNGTILNANSANKSGPSQDAIMITNAIDRLSTEQRAIRNDINNMRSDITGLGNRIDGMYVRLDGNALVGQIVNPMDTAMGAKSIKNARRRV